MDTNFSKKIIKLLLCIPACLLCTTVCLYLLAHVIFRQADRAPIAAVQDVQIIDVHDDLIDSKMQASKDHILDIPKRFWLSEDTLIAPEPDPACYGTATSAAELGWLLEAAAPVLDGQSTLFSTETVIMSGSEITYYLDETIFAVTWKQIMTDYVFTVSEVKISDPSQFRRHLADNDYYSKRLYDTTVMAQTVNAVVGSSADYYRGRKFGIVVYDGNVMRIDNPSKADVCYIDKNGDLLFSYHGDLMDMESAQEFVNENDISFSISFGPILIDNGERCDPENYPIGEINDNYARAALCQRDKLHYFIVAANYESVYTNNQTIHEFTDNLMQFGCQKAYTLDGGNTAAIAMDGKLINRTAFGYQRMLSDIIYFATAKPNKSVT